MQFNHAGLAPWPLRTARAVGKFAMENSSYGSLHYTDWEQSVLDVRAQCAELIGAKRISEIALTKNTSEGLSIVASGIDWQPGQNIIFYADEFPSNRFVWEAIAQRFKLEIRMVPPCANMGNLEDALLQQIDDKTRLLTVSSIQYTTGYKADLKKIGEHCKNHKVLFCIDGIQSLGATPFEVEEYHADFVCADGHKWLMSPEGSGIFYCRSSRLEELKLYQYGWHTVQNSSDYTQANWQLAKDSSRFECGSMNHLGILALRESLSLLLEIGIENIHKEIINNVNYLFDNLDKNMFEPVTIMEQGKYAGILTVRPLHVDNNKLFQSLVRLKLLCANRAGGIRLSPHFYTTKEMMDQALQLLHEQAKKLAE